MKDLDIEKIKAALQVINAYINDGSMLPQDMAHPYFKASDSLDYLILAIAAYDPDAIRRECYAEAEKWYLSMSLSRKENLLAL